MPFSTIGEKSELECAICLEVWTNPRELKPCDHIFCEACLKPLKTTKECPQCKAHFKSTKVPNRVVLNMAANVQVKCDLCPWEGTRERSAQHVVCLPPAPAPVAVAAVPAPPPPPPPVCASPPQVQAPAAVMQPSAPASRENSMGGLLSQQSSGFHMSQHPLVAAGSGSNSNLTPSGTFKAELGYGECSCRSNCGERIPGGNTTFRIGVGFQARNSNEVWWYYHHEACFEEKVKPTLSPEQQTEVAALIRTAKERDEKKRINQQHLLGKETKAEYGRGEAQCGTCSSGIAAQTIRVGRGYVPQTGAKFVGDVWYRWHHLTCFETSVMSTLSADLQATVRSQIRETQNKGPPSSSASSYRYAHYQARTDGNGRGKRNR